jgi:hypothetical protein
MKHKNRPLGLLLVVCPCLLPLLGCDSDLIRDILGGHHRPPPADSGAGGSGGNECGLSPEQLATAYLVPLSSPGTGGRGGGRCPELQPVEGLGADTFDPGPERGPCGRHPEVRLQPTRVPCTAPGTSFTYRITIANRDAPGCPERAWQFTSDGFANAVDPPGPVAVTPPVGGEQSVCLKVTSPPEAPDQGSSRVDFRFDSGDQARAGALWHPTQRPR